MSGDVLLVDTAEAARRLSISIRGVERLTADGELPAVKIGARRLYRAADLVAYVEQLSPAGQPALQVVRG